MGKYIGKYVSLSCTYFYRHVNGSEVQKLEWWDVSFPYWQVTRENMFFHSKRKFSDCLATRVLEFPPPPEFESVELLQQNRYAFISDGFRSVSTNLNSYQPVVVILRIVFQIFRSMFNWPRRTRFNWRTFGKNFFLEVTLHILYSNRLQACERKHGQIGDSS